MSAQPNRYDDAYAQWDDRASVYRVYLLPVDTGQDPPPEAVPMSAVDVEGDGATECRLYRAAFVRCPKDIGKLKAMGRELGFEKEAAARRVASAVKKELESIEKGKPGPTDAQIQFALMMIPKRKVAR